MPGSVGAPAGVSLVGGSFRVPSGGLRGPGFQAVSVPQQGSLSSVVAFVPHLGVNLVEDSK